MDNAAFSLLYSNRKGPFHLSVDGRLVVRRETGKRVFGSLVDYDDKIVLHEEVDGRENSVLKIAFPARNWLSRRAEQEVCNCDEPRCEGRVTVRLHESHPAPSWTLDLEGAA